MWRRQGTRSIRAGLNLICTAIVWEWTDLLGKGEVLLKFIQCGGYGLVIMNIQIHGSDTELKTFGPTRQRCPWATEKIGIWRMGSIRSLSRFPV